MVFYKDINSLKLMKELDILKICEERRPGFEYEVLQKLKIIFQAYLDGRIDLEELIYTILCISVSLEDLDKVAGFDIIDVLDVNVAKDPKQFIMQQKILLDKCLKNQPG